MKITQKQIADIARATKRCHREGLGNRIVVFADGSWTEAVSDNDVIARGDGGSGWEYPITRYKYPMSRADIVADLERVAAERAWRAQLDDETARRAAEDERYYSSFDRPEY